MNDWKTNASALLPGARSEPVGTPSGITDVPSAKFGTKRAGNSSAPIFRRAVANFSPSPKVTKWLRQATSLPGGVDAALQEVEARGPVEVVPHVVFARPQQLDRRAHLLGDPRRLDHVVVVQPPAEAAAACASCGS